MLDRYWLIFATGLSFSIFGVCGVVLTIILLPILWVTPDSNYRQKIGKKFLKQCFKSFVWGMQFFGAISVKTEHLDLLKPSGTLVLANHPSLIDAVIIMALIENPDGIIKSSLFNNPCMYGLVKFAGLIRNEEGPDLIRKSIESIRNGNNLLIFPEGTRTIDLAKVNFKRGAGYIAVRGKINIVPVFVFLSEPALRKGMPWYRVPNKKPIFTISVRPEINTQAIANCNGDLILESEVLTKYLEVFFMRELG